MKCPECQSENPEDGKFCGMCRAKLLKVCPQCGRENSPGNLFCNECGHELPTPSKPAPANLSFDEKIAKIQRYLPEGLTEKILSQRDRIEGERKQVTVMFCDMEGFSALTERLGPEEAYSIMDEVYEILIHKVHDYEGTVNEMTGDGIVALFGAPIALEDAPQRAIRSAMAIHREMSRFSERLGGEKAGVPPVRMRIGIHSGPVVVGTLGNDLRVEFKAVGDTVNLASRMEELAKPGTTYVSRETFKLTEGLFRFEALGKQPVKGKEEPVGVYQVIAPSTRRTRFDVGAERGLTPFVGRERELELLLDGFERAKAGSGQAFSIVAEAGLGKSRLLYEFRKAVANEDITFLEGKSLSYSRGIAYHPVIDMLKSYFEILEEDGTSRIAEKVRSGLRFVGADELRTLPDLLDLLSVEENGVERIPLSPEIRRARIIEALKNIVVRGSKIRPLIMAFEDLHWADKTSESVLKSLLDDIPGIRVLLLFTYRPEFVHAWGGRSYHSQLNLNRLSNRESLIMVNHLLGRADVDRDVQELILEKTEGVPFFIEEFVKSLRDLRVIEQRGAAYGLRAGLQEVTIPSTVQDVIMARIDSLPEGAKEVLQAGSVIDREFSYELLRRVTDLPEQELLSRLSALRDAELLYERGIYPHCTYVFKHALTQEVASNGLLLKRKRLIHEKIATAIEELFAERLEEHHELLAYHYARSDNKPKTVGYLVLATRKATRASAVDEARMYFDDCMNLLDTMPDSEENRESRICLLGDSFGFFGLLLRMEEYYAFLMRYEAILPEIRSSHVAGAFYVSIAFCELMFGAYDRAIENAKRGVALCEMAGHAVGAGRGMIVLLNSHVFRGELKRTVAMKEEALRHGDERVNPRTAVVISNAFANAYASLGCWHEAVEWGKNSMRIAEKYPDHRLISLAAYNVCAVHTQQGDLERAIEYGERAIKQASTPNDHALSQMALSGAKCRAGEMDRVIQDLEEVIEACKTGHLVTYEIAATPSLVEAYLQSALYDEATRTAEELIGLAERCGAGYYLGRGRRLLGEISLRTRPDEAGPFFKEAIQLLCEIDAENDLALAYSGMGRFHKQQGNTEQAREYLTKALEIFERLGTLLEPDKVKQALAALPS